MGAIWNPYNSFTVLIELACTAFDSKVFQPNINKQSDIQNMLIKDNNSFNTTLIYISNIYLLLESDFIILN